MKITHETAHTVSAGGKTYEADKGVFDVPEEHALLLIESHGFKRVEAPKAKDTKKGDAE